MNPNINNKQCLEELREIPPKRVVPDNIDSVNRIFYICSYTGCGTMLLRKALTKQGYITRIIHDRNPPKELEFTGYDFMEEKSKQLKRIFKFNGVRVPEKYLSKITVIYIYKNPINSIYSRLIRKHMSIYVSPNGEQIDFDDVIKQEKDLYGLESFFNNYTRRNQGRNYNIICVNYHKLFEKQDELSELLGVGPLEIEMKEREHEQKNYETLKKIYKSLIFKFNTLNPFITVV